ncbi:MAG: energy transducer TonB [Crocinitomicaceae bacterium]|nr:energy transducer TonB [Crocinitomicaceae bacterium]
MENKKSNEADLEPIRSSLFMVGLNYIAGIVLAAFTFQTISGDNGMAELNEKSAENVYQQEEKKEETPPPPAATAQVNAPPPVTENIVERENTEEEPITVVEVAEETIIVEEEIIEFPDVEAEFIGGAQAMMKYIQQNIQYPPTSIEMNEQGKVYLSFVVEPDGTISNVAIERGVSKDIDNEAKRIVRSMPKWTPGEAKGKKSRTRCRLPINFQLG